jgi:hypothetical protein
MVLAHLSDDKHSLVSALLVHPTWTRHAVPILWRDVGLYALLNVGDRDRRRLYADRVHRLSVLVWTMGDVEAADFSLSFPRLRELTIDSNEWLEDVDDLEPAAETGPPVEHATALRSALRALATGLQHAPLARLELRVGGWHPDGVLPCLASLATLRVLVVDFGAATLRADDILALQALTRLSELRIKGEEEDYNDDVFEAPEFGDEDLLELLGGLTRLRRLEFIPEVCWSDDGPLLRLVGEVAPALEELSLYGHLNVQALDPGAVSPVFPRLGKLSLSGVELVMPPDTDETDLEAVRYLE